jgi:hypothetical protein
MNTRAHWEMDAFWKWLDLEPSLTVAIITGSGRAFSAGADLKEWDNSMAADANPKDRLGNAPAFKPLSRRLGKKPVIAAVNGLSMGAGTEFAINWFVESSGMCRDAHLAEIVTWSLPPKMHSSHSQRSSVASRRLVEPFHASSERSVFNEPASLHLRVGTYQLKSYIAGAW